MEKAPDKKVIESNRTMNAICKGKACDKFETMSDRQSGKPDFKLCKSRIIGKVKFNFTLFACPPCILEE
jgi:hypothetical protein